MVNRPTNVNWVFIFNAWEINSDLKLKVLNEKITEKKADNIGIYIYIYIREWVLKESALFVLYFTSIKYIERKKIKERIRRENIFYFPQNEITI